MTIRHGVTIRDAPYFLERYIGGLPVSSDYQCNALNIGSINVTTQKKEQIPTKALLFLFITSLGF